MLRVAIDLVPYGLEYAKRNLHTLEIANVAPEGVTIDKDGNELFSYSVRSIDEGGAVVDHGIVITDFDRSKSAYELVSIIAKKLGFFKRQWR
jgi:hypothetical protein